MPVTGNKDPAALRLNCCGVLKNQRLFIGFPVPLSDGARAVHAPNAAMAAAGSTAIAPVTLIRILVPFDRIWLIVARLSVVKFGRYRRHCDVHRTAGDVVVLVP